MTALRPCDLCARHVRGDSAECPFCGARLEAAPTPPMTALPASKLTRVAIFAGAAMLLQACGGGEPEAEESGGDENTGGETTTGDDTGGESSCGTGNCSAEGGTVVPDAGQQANPDDPNQPDPVADPVTPAPPYGAPPADAGPV